MNTNIKNSILNNDDQVIYHVALSRNMIKFAKTAIVPGDPGRVEMLAKMLDKDAKHIATNREYTSWLAKVDNSPVLVISSGIGGAAISICLEELAMLGVKNFIRVGTTGSIQETINLGDIILSSGAVRFDGASNDFVTIEYPAVSDFYLNRALVKSSESNKIPIHVGVTASTATFWSGQERYDSYSQHVHRKNTGLLQEMRKSNVLNFEMECATLFTFCATMGLRSAALCSIIAKRVQSETVDKTFYMKSMENIMHIIKSAISEIKELKD